VNKEKMNHGIPLSDEDRLPWLNAVRALIEKCLSEGTDAVIACSALRQAYRNILLADPARVKFIYLKGSKALIERRIAQRTGHFMNKDLLQSQFDTLEEPADAITVDVSGDPNSVVNLIRARLGL
jgi:gluconokinase